MIRELLAKSADDAKRLLDAEGVCIVRDVLDRAGIERAKRALLAGIASDESSGVPVRGFPFDPDTKNVRLFDLIGKDPVFAELAEHPLALELVTHSIGTPFLLSNFSANVTAPGSAAMYMHADQGYVPAPWPPYPMATNVAWALDDFSAANGGTRFVPRSHLRDRGPDPSVQTETVAMECPAGSIFVMDARVWHQTGPNRTADQTRAGLFGYYVRPFIRPQWNWYQTVTPELLARLSPGMREMLGFGSNVTSSLESLYMKKSGIEPRRDALAR
ncbi:MAG TPA: phytanoyl-CoA dioxygenase family protein [Myxococcota bacterium]|nr:phytanoyl-CoA dioxygenase family protein [Myxococcota bacterium]